jgi:uncharacterized membrane protein
MTVMALDHVRDFFYRDVMAFSPTDLTKTTAILFFTRWITHFCLPVFMFTAGMGVYFRQRLKGGPASELSRFLWTRGVWFVILELTVMRLAYNFNLSPRFMVFLLILWIFGLCMILMAPLVRVPIRVLAPLAIGAIALHNCLDGISFGNKGVAGWVWSMLHQPNILNAAGTPVLVTYTILPWLAVMAAGYCFGEVFMRGPATRRRISLRTGAALTIAFVIIRGINLYGDPARWSTQKSSLFTLLSFLNCTKYPASLDFLLMTLGPALMLLAYLDRLSFKTTNPLVVFGRVPLFYFVIHFFAIHTLAVAMAWLRYGRDTLHFMFNPLPIMGGPRDLFPATFGYSLPIVYLVWIGVVACLYPLCRWFAKVKSTRRDWWLSYL